MRTGRSRSGRRRCFLTQPGFAVVAAAALDGRDVGTSRKVVGTACGRCENTGMGFSADRRTVGRNWGAAPVRIEPVAGSVCLKLPPGAWRCRALSPSGRPGEEVALKRQAGASVVEMSPAHKTMWYLLTAE